MQMNFNLIVNKTIQINTNIETVWEGLTNPEIIADYFFGTETITDWKVGNDIIFQGEFDNYEYHDHGKILENILYERLSYSYWTEFAGLDDLPENYAKVTYSLKKIDEDTTEFTWKQEGFANEESFEHSISGMDEFLQGIKTTIENLG